MVTGEQIPALQDGELDLGLARPPFDENVLESQLLFSESLMHCRADRAPPGCSAARSLSKTWQVKH